MKDAISWNWSPHQGAVKINIEPDINSDRDYAELQLVDVFDHHNAVGILYNHLANRPSVANISHKEMPSLAKHTGFVERYIENRSGASTYTSRRDSYTFWYIIELIEREAGKEPSASYTPVGNVYMTPRNEVGIFLLASFTGLGWGSAVLDHLEEQAHKIGATELYANIAPGNEDSKVFFRKRGYHILQETYALDLRERDI